jgi:hypothetical protein
MYNKLPVCVMRNVHRRKVDFDETFFFYARLINLLNCKSPIVACCKVLSTLDISHNLFILLPNDLISFFSLDFISESFQF